MSYYTGSANSFADIRTALFNACVTEGWALSTDVLTKGAAAVKITVNTTSVSTLGLGIIIQGGTSASGSALVNPSPITPRFGPPSSLISQPTFPMEYYIHIGISPDEVYLIARFNVDYLYFLAFGLSDVPGLGSTGLWLSATSGAAQGWVQPGVNMSLTGGGTVNANQTSTAALFWSTTHPSLAQARAGNATIASNLDAVLWAGSPTSGTATTAESFSAIQAATTMLAVQPNNWNSDATLNRIQTFVWRASGKCSLIADLKHARFVRVDNYNMGQVVELGSDKWKVYPFYKKDITARNGGSSIDHSGTFGWAIRYDGP